MGEFSGKGDESAAIESWKENIRQYLTMLKRNGIHATFWWATNPFGTASQWSLYDQVAISTTSVATGNPCVITCGSAHGLVTGQPVGLRGFVSTPTINGDWDSVTVIDGTRFSIPVNVTSVTDGVGTVTRWQNNPLADVLDEFLPLSDSSWLLGCNLVGGEFGRGVNFGAGTGGTYSNLNPGTYGSAYIYPDDPNVSNGQGRNLIGHLAWKGHKVVKILFTAERMWDFVGNALITAEADRLKACMDRCWSRNIKTIPTNTAYGAVWIDSAGTGVRHWIGDGTVTTAQLTSMWRAIVARAGLGNHASIHALAIDDEPVSMPTNDAAGAANYKAYVDAVKNGIRTEEGLQSQSAHRLMLPTYHYSGVQRLGTYHSTGPTSIVTSTDANDIFEVHDYSDTDNSGSFANTYATELTNAQATYTPAQRLDDRAGLAGDPGYYIDGAGSSLPSWTISGGAIDPAPEGTVIMAAGTSTVVAAIPPAQTQLADFTCEYIANIVDPNSGTEVTLNFRRLDSSNRLILQLFPTLLRLRKVVAGVFTTLGSDVTLNGKIPHHIRIQASGSSIKVWVDHAALPNWDVSVTENQANTGFRIEAFNSTAATARGMIQQLWIASPQQLAQANRINILGPTLKSPTSKHPIRKKMADNDTDTTNDPE